MLIAERQSRLEQLLAQRGMADLDSLAQELGVSQSTIRRDLEVMEQRRVVRRTHGGVIWIGDRQNGGPATRPYAFDQRMDFQADVKRSIARRARELVQPGQTILIDGGTTTYFLACELIGMSLQLVTNSPPIANLFVNDEQIELVLTGGLLYPRYGVLLGPVAEGTLQSIHTQTLFLSVAGVQDGALFNQNMLLVQSERRMIDHAQRVVLLADSGKFGQRALARLGDLAEVDTVVTDKGLSDEHANAIVAAGCELILAG